MTSAKTLSKRLSAKLRQAGGSRTRRVLAIALLQLVAVAIGAGAALHTGAARSAVAYAGTHCTRYAPTVSQDVNCSSAGTIQPASIKSYFTPGVALRDQNHMHVVFPRELFVCYSGDYCGSNPNGDDVYIYASHGYRQANCSMNGSAVTGFCRTDWHD
jgi:hypothetical protein